MGLENSQLQKVEKVNFEDKPAIDEGFKNQFQLIDWTTEVQSIGRIGVQIGAVNSIDFGIIGGEIGQNGIRLSCPFGSIRLFGNE